MKNKNIELLRNWLNLMEIKQERVKKITLRTVNRYIHKYREYGKEAFVHGNRNRKPSCTFDEAIKLRVLNLYQDVYYDCNVQHFSEFLLRKEGIEISPRTLLTWLKDIDNQLARIIHSENYPRRSRLANFGELLQMDASEHHWFGEHKPKAHLHATIDDATDRLLGMHS